MPRTDLLPCCTLSHAHPRLTVDARRVLQFPHQKTRKIVRSKLIQAIHLDKHDKHSVTGCYTSFEVDDVAAVPQVVRTTTASELMTRIADTIAAGRWGKEGLMATACNVADSLIGLLFAPRTLKSHNDPQVQLSGNCAPVPESPPKSCHLEFVRLQTSQINGKLLDNGKVEEDVSHGKRCLAQTKRVTAGFSRNTEGGTKYVTQTGTNGKMNIHLPQDLCGIYVRNGPNASRLFEREGYHMFDGDGMLHAVRINSSGTASYCCRYVRTSRFVQEEIAGRPLFIKFFGGFQGFIVFARGALVLVRALLGLLNVGDGWGLSNTSVCFFQNMLLSLSEEDMPYAVRVTQEGDLITLGRVKFLSPNGKPAQIFNVCAHPKFHPTTGDMFAFSFKPSLTEKGPLSFFKVSSSGVVSSGVHIPLRDIPFLHDFAITQHFAVFPDNQFVFKPFKLFKGQMPAVCDTNKTPMFCLMPLQALDQGSTDFDVGQGQATKPLWFEAPGCNAFHYINAWEEGDAVVIITPVISPPEHFLEMPAKSIVCMLTEIRLNLKTGETKRSTICPGANLEFGTFNQRYTGKKTRYVYMASGFYPELTGVVKVDLQKKVSCPKWSHDEEEPHSCIVAMRDFGPNCHGNEPCFVPRMQSFLSSSPSSCDDNNVDELGEEDDGYLLCLVHNNATNVSRLLVMDAQSPSLEIIASIKLPSRVPYGFHGCFVREDQLATQL